MQKSRIPSESTPVIHSRKSDQSVIPSFKGFVTFATSTFFSKWYGPVHPKILGENVTIIMIIYFLQNNFYIPHWLAINVSSTAGLPSWITTRSSRIPCMLDNTSKSCPSAIRSPGVKIRVRVKVRVRVRVRVRIRVRIPIRVRFRVEVGLCSDYQLCWYHTLWSLPIDPSEPSPCHGRSVLLQFPCLRYFLAHQFWLLE